MYQGHVRKGITRIVALLFVLSLFMGQVGFAGQSAFARQSEPVISSTGFSWCLVDESGNETQMVASSLQELVETGIVRLSQDGLRFAFNDGRSRPGNCTGTPTSTPPPVTETPTTGIPEISSVSLDCSGLLIFSVTNASSIQDGQGSATILIVTNDPEEGVINVGGTYILTLTTGQSDYAVQLYNTEYWPTDVTLFARAYTHDVQAGGDSAVFDCGGETETPEPTTPVGTETPTTEPTTEPTEAPTTETPSVTPTSSATVTTTPTTTATPTATPTPKPRIYVTPKNVVPGQSVDVSVTNFDANESVRVRWRVGSKWVQVGVIATDGSGAGSIAATVPRNVSAGANSVRADGANRAQQTNGVVVTIPGPPTAALSTTRTTVNAGVTFTTENFLPNSTISITWRRPGGSTLSLGAVTADSSGAAAGSFSVPATEGGAANRVIFTSGATSVSIAFDVAPRIKVTPATASRSQSVEVSVRGYGKQEAVRIRWRVNGAWITVATITTSNTGSANVIVTVPANATLGQNSVRGDGTVFRRQTNAVTVIP